MSFCSFHNFTSFITITYCRVLVSALFFLIVVELDTAAVVAAAAVAVAAVSIFH